MKKTPIHENKLTKGQKEKLQEAKKDFEKLFEEIKPFLKKRRFKQPSPVGEWSVSDFDQ